MNLTWAWANEYFHDLPPIKLEDRTITHRRNFLVALGIATCYYAVGIRPGGFSAAFVSGTFERPELVEWFLWLIVAYEAVMYHSTRMGDEIQFFRTHEQYFNFKAAVNYAQLRVAAFTNGLTVDASKEGGQNRSHRLDQEAGGELVGMYRLTTIATSNGLNMVKSREEGVQTLLQLGIPGLSPSPDQRYDVEYRHPDTEEERRFTQKAFPRIRRLVLLEFMQVWFPYWALFVSVVVRVCMLMPWSRLVSWAVCC